MSYYLLAGLNDLGAPITIRTGPGGQLTASTPGLRPIQPPRIPTGGGTLFQPLAPPKSPPLAPLGPPIKIPAVSFRVAPITTPPGLQTEAGAARGYVPPRTSTGITVVRSAVAPRDVIHAPGGGFLTPVPISTPITPVSPAPGAVVSPIPGSAKFPRPVPIVMPPIVGGGPYIPPGSILPPNIQPVVPAAGGGFVNDPNYPVSPWTAPSPTPAAPVEAGMVGGMNPWLLGLTALAILAFGGKQKS